jgi:hypothetical protein
MQCAADMHSTVGSPGTARTGPIHELPEWYSGLVDAINARPMRFTSLEAATLAL